MTNQKQDPPAAEVLVWGLALQFGAAPALVGLAFAFAGGGNIFLGTPDTPNGFLLFLAVVSAAVGLVMALKGIFRLVNMINDVGSVALRHMLEQVPRRE